MKIPEVILEAIDRGAHVSVSVSGGKDSQAMLSVLMDYLPVAKMEVVHADLGRAEWPQTPGFVQQLVEAAGLPLSVVRRVKGDLVQRIEERLQSVSTLDPTRPAKPFWPSAQQRYCTSDMKRGPIQKQQRGIVKEGIIVSCIGFRAEESRARAKRIEVTVEKAISSKPYKDLTPDEALRRYDGGRLVLTWLPIHAWEVGQVWERLHTTGSDVARRQELYRAGEIDRALDGWRGHPAYVFGNERLSCALCVLASIGDLCNGRRHNPELFNRYVELERQSGYTFRDGLSLESLAEKN